MHVGLLIGLGAGLTSALVLATASGPVPAAPPLMLLVVPLPLVVAGLGWGWQAALVGAIAAALVLAIGADAGKAVLHAVSIGAPMAALAYLAKLYRQRDRDGPGRAGVPVSLEWYPCGRLLAAIGLIGGAVGMAGLLGTATSNAGLETVIRKFVEPIDVTPWVQFQQGSKPVTAAHIAAFKERMVQAMVLHLGNGLAMLWILMATFNVWLGAHVVRKSGLLGRPWPDLSTLVMPRGLALVFGVAALGMFIPDYPGKLAVVMASAILTVYALAGLAIVHNLTRGLDSRALILVGTYTGVVLLFPLGGLPLATLALAEPFLPFRRKGPFDAEYPPPPPT